MKPPPQPGATRPGDACAQSQGRDTKGKAAAPSPQLAPSSPSGQEDPDPSLPSFPTGPAEQMPLRPAAFSLQLQARPVGSLFAVGLGGRYPGLQRKVPVGGAPPAGPHPRGEDNTGASEPQGTKKAL